MASHPDRSRTGGQARSGRRWPAALAGVLLLLLFVGWVTTLEEGSTVAGISFTPEAFAERIRGWGAWGPAASIGLMVLHSFVPFPAELLAIANGMLWGLAVGTLITWSGAMLGALLAFGLARWLGRGYVERWVAERRRAVIDAFAEEHGWTTLLTVRLVPVIAFNLINYAAGLTTVSWWTFAWTTGLGILPLTVLMVLLGEHMTAMPAWAWGLVLPVALLSWWLLRRAQLAYRTRARRIAAAAAPEERGG